MKKAPDPSEALLSLFAVGLKNSTELDIWDIISFRNKVLLYIAKFLASKKNLRNIESATGTGFFILLSNHMY